LLALLLALALSLSFTTVFAAEETDSAPPSEVETLTEEPVTEPETEKVDLKKQIVPESEVPDLIDYDIAVEEKYVCRAYWEETALNEVVFLKADGSLARYVFSFPVKYEADGEVYDKQPELVARETLLADTYRYELTAQNDTTLYCAENLSKGFFFQGEDMQVNLRPITKDEYDLLRGHIDMGAIVTPMGGLSLTTYDSVAVTGTAQSALATESKSTTAALYALSTTGQQASLAAVQDTLAVVPSYTGFQLQLDLAEGATSTTLYFELDPNGLILARPADTLLLYDKSGNAVGIVGDLLSDQGMSHDVAYTVTALDNGNYLLAATLPRTSGGNYTMSVTSYYDYIQDATIYNAYNTNAFGQSANLWVGYVSDMGVERVLIRPNNWTFTQDAYPNRTIQSASVVIRDITVTTPQETIACHPFTGNNWEENTATWSTVQGDSIGSLIDFNAVSSSIGASSPTGYYYYFDVTDYVQDWYDGDTSWTKGFAFRWVQESNPFVMEKCFASTQYSTERYRPRIEITETLDAVIQEGIYRIKKASGTEPSYLTSDNAIADGTEVSFQQKMSDSSYHQLWRVHNMGNGWYTIRPMHYTSLALHATESDVDVRIVGNDQMDLVPSEATWCVTVGESGYELKTFGNGCILLYGTSEVYAASPSYGDHAEWSFEPVENVPYEVLFYDRATG
ncbi:MAG: RICIN domain-containing protein, partial [Clostridia bacterium]|nr:RICIN domain-containing protein [Clostridia bacterium]